MKTIDKFSEIERLILTLVFFVCEEMGKGNKQIKARPDVRLAIGSLLEDELLIDVKVGSSKSFVLSEKGLYRMHQMLDEGITIDTFIERVFGDEVSNLKEYQEKVLDRFEDGDTE